MDVGAQLTAFKLCLYHKTRFLSPSRFCMLAFSLIEPAN